jgi:nucleotide-binding universal stress UspA family protein
MIAVDASAQAERAFRYAINHTSPEDTLLIVSAHEHRPALPDKHGRINDEAIHEFNKRSRINAASVLDKYDESCRRYSRRCRFMLVPSQSTATSAANIGETLCKVAEEEKADTIFMGHRGLSGIKRLLLGSVSTYCVNSCSCNVTVVKHD